MKKDKLLRQIRNSLDLYPKIEIGASTQNIDEELESRICSIKHFQELVDLLERTLSAENSEIDLNFSEDDFSPDVLAYYRSFRRCLITPTDFWGITFRIPNCRRFIQMMSLRMKLPIVQVVRPAMLFILEHEFNHFDRDLCQLMIEINRNGADKLILPNHSCWHEESLGQTRAWRKIRKNASMRKVIDFIKDYYESTNLKGYNEFDVYKDRINEGFDEIVEHNIQNNCSAYGNAVLAHLGMNPQEYSHRSIPLFLEFNMNSHSVMQLRTVTGIRWSNTAEKEKKKIYKGDVRRRKDLERTLELLSQDPHHPSLRTEKFKTVKGDWSVHVGHEERMLLCQDESGVVLIKDIGKKIYSHGT